MRRRDFIGFGGATLAAWPLSTRAQQDGRVRRVGVLMGNAADQVGQGRVAAFREGMQTLKWIEGGNIAYEVRWAAGDVAVVKMQVAEIVGLAPDMILASNTPIVRALKTATQKIPIVFAGLSDPVGDGIVASLAKPGGNITGFSSFEAGMAGKWLQLLKEIAPGTQRVAVLYNPSTAPYSMFWPTLETSASALGVMLVNTTAETPAAIEAVIADTAGTPASAVILLPDVFTTRHRALIVAALAQHKLPAVWALPFYANDGGLIAYGPDFEDQFRRAAAYVDRILRGASTPADMPVQQPTKFELKINLKTAKALGLTVPPTLLATADELIE